MNPDPPSDLPAKHSKPRFNRWIFFGTLFAPAVVTLIMPAFYENSGVVWDNVDDYLVVLVSTSAIAGTFCCWQLIRLKASLSSGVKVLVGFLYFITCFAAAFTLGFGGCLLGFSLT